MAVWSTEDVKKLLEKFEAPSYVLQYVISQGINGQGLDFILRKANRSNNKAFLVIGMMARLSELESMWSQIVLKQIPPQYVFENLFDERWSHGNSGETSNNFNSSTNKNNTKDQDAIIKSLQNDIIDLQKIIEIQEETSVQNAKTLQQLSIIAEECSAHLENAKVEAEHLKEKISAEVQNNDILQQRLQMCEIRLMFSEESLVRQNLQSAKLLRTLELYEAKREAVMKGFEVSPVSYRVGDQCNSNSKHYAYYNNLDNEYCIVPNSRERYFHSESKNKHRNDGSEIKLPEKKKIWSNEEMLSKAMYTYPTFQQFHFEPETKHYLFSTAKFTHEGMEKLSRSVYDGLDMDRKVQMWHDFVENMPTELTEVKQSNGIHSLTDDQHSRNDTRDSKEIDLSNIEAIVDSPAGDVVSIFLSETSHWSVLKRSLFVCMQQYTNATDAFCNQMLDQQLNQASREGARYRNNNANFGSSLSRSPASARTEMAYATSDEFIQYHKSVAKYFTKLCRFLNKRHDKLKSLTERIIHLLPKPSKSQNVADQEIKTSDTNTNKSDIKSTDESEEEPINSNKKAAKKQLTINTKRNDAESLLQLYSLIRDIQSDTFEVLGSNDNSCSNYQRPDTEDPMMYELGFNEFNYENVIIENSQLHRDIVRLNKLLSSEENRASQPKQRVSEPHTSSRSDHKNRLKLEKPTTNALSKESSNKNYRDDSMHAPENIHDDDEIRSIAISDSRRESMNSTSAALPPTNESILNVFQSPPAKPARFSFMAPILGKFQSLYHSIQRQKTSTSSASSALSTSSPTTDMVTEDKPLQPTKLHKTSESERQKDSTHPNNTIANTESNTTSDSAIVKRDAESQIEILNRDNVGVKEEKHQISTSEAQQTNIVEENNKSEHERTNIAANTADSSQAIEIKPNSTQINNRDNAMEVVATGKQYRNLYSFYNDNKEMFTADRDFTTSEFDASNRKGSDIQFLSSSNASNRSQSAEDSYANSSYRRNADTSLYSNDRYENLDRNTSNISSRQFESSYSEKINSRIERPETIGIENSQFQPSKPSVDRTTSSRTSYGGGNRTVRFAVEANQTDSQSVKSMAYPQKTFEKPNPPSTPYRSSSNHVNSKRWEYPTSPIQQSDFDAYSTIRGQFNENAHAVNNNRELGASEYGATSNNHKSTGQHYNYYSDDNYSTPQSDTTDHVNDFKRGYFHSNSDIAQKRIMKEYYNHKDTNYYSSYLEKKVSRTQPTQSILVEMHEAMIPRQLPMDPDQLRQVENLRSRRDILRQVRSEVIQDIVSKYPHNKNEEF